MYDIGCMAVSEGGLKASSGTVELYRSTYGTDFDNSGIAGPVLWVGDGRFCRESEVPTNGVSRVYINIYTCVACIMLCIYTHMYVYICICIYLYLYTRAHVCTCFFSYLHVFVPKGLGAYEFAF